MDNDKIKAIVNQAKALKEGEESAPEVAAAILRDMSRSPRLAVGIIQHLREEGHDLMALEGEQAQAFRDKFGPQIAKLGQRDFDMIRRISAKMFAS